MAPPLKRSEAIQRVVEKRLAQLSQAEKVDLLASLMGSDWEDDPLRTQIPEDIWHRIQEEEFTESTDLTEFGTALRMSLLFKLRSVSHYWLEQQLSHKVEEVPIPFFACPCCGYQTLSLPDEYDICKVCFWEDMGHDNENADRYSHPNHMTLLEGRRNYILTGNCDGEEVRGAHLRSPEEFYRLREFRLREDGAMIEVGTDWVGYPDKTER